MSVERLVVLTGAGISAESGLSTFRGGNGLWDGYKLEDVCTPEGFEKNPRLVQEFYNSRRKQLTSGVIPNLAHHALAEFAKGYRGKFTLITQNVDNLHECAGSENVLHMHGELLKARCSNTLKVFTWREDITLATPCPCCNTKGTLRPNIVWFGEIPLCMFDIEAALANCDLFVAIGTSGQVYPAAGFVQTAAANGASTIEFNLDEPSGVFEKHIHGNATQTVPAFFYALMLGSE